MLTLVARLACNFLVSLPFATMDRALLEENLRLAQANVAMGSESIARQRAIILDLQLESQDTTEAITLLRSFEAAQVFHLKKEVRLAKELAALDRLT